MLAHRLHTHGSTSSLHRNVAGVHTCPAAGEEARIIAEGPTSDRVPSGSRGEGGGAYETLAAPLIEWQVSKYLFQ